MLACFKVSESALVSELTVGAEGSQLALCSGEDDGGAPSGRFLQSN